MCKVIPKFVRWMIGYICFPRWYLGHVKKSAIESQKRKYPSDFVMTYVDGNGRDFDFGFDYNECAICKFLSAQNSLELAPYICATDKFLRDMLGLG